MASPLDNTVYEILVISDAGCEARGIVSLTVDKTRKIYGPNIFSPNDDGRNELFSIYASPVAVQRIKSLRVYSRWERLYMSGTTSHPMTRTLAGTAPSRGKN
ncbi:MAG: hypothetical protein IPH31_26440 [Lewinellaceae bacterium]|nr:hypothetical protein [Lewinellaceae bacterium]